MRQTEIIICDCHSEEHQVVFVWEEEIHEDHEFNQVYMHFHLVKYGFWTRVKTAFWHILGRKSRYGAWDEIIISTDDIHKFEKVVEFLKKVKAHNED